MSRLLLVCDRLGNLRSHTVDNDGTSVFNNYPELLLADFWIKMHDFARSPDKASPVLAEMDGLGKQGASLSPEIGRNMQAVMRVVRETLRSQSIANSIGKVFAGLVFTIVLPGEFLAGRL